MLKICFYAPVDHVEKIKEAMFRAGAGKIGHYDSCAWQTLGEGQFRPLSGHHAFLGETHQLEKVKEFKVEMVCSDEVVEYAIDALRKNHPYETPAYQVWKLWDI